MFETINNKQDKNKKICYNTCCKIVSENNGRERTALFYNKLYKQKINVENKEQSNEK